MSRGVGTTLAGAVLTRCERAPDAAARLLGCPVLGTVPDVTPPVLARDSVRDAYGRVAREATERSTYEEDNRQGARWYGHG